MKHSNIAVFIPHNGCSHECSFCNQRIISGETHSPTASEVDLLLKEAVSKLQQRQAAEIAFFGGSFTAINKEYMVSLLQTAQKYVRQDGLMGIRISTRPDAIDDQTLILLKKYGVTSIELGAQSMSDEVLFKNNRGHTADDVIKASSMIKSHGFSLGLQMMVGLYGDTAEDIINTANRFILIKPDTVRIYPTVILKGTMLEKLYRDGIYIPMQLECAVQICAQLLSMFRENGISVIKLGLHASQDVEANMVGGIYHPAFRELCESEIYYKLAVDKLAASDIKRACIFVSPEEISKMIGQRKNNLIRLSNEGYEVKVKGDNSLCQYELKINSM